MRLIDADKLKDDFDDYINTNPTTMGIFGVGKTIIENAPTVELLLARGSARCEIIIPLTRSVGEWIFHKDYHESVRYGCNQCGNLNNTPGNFCPNCGAYMKKRSLGDLWGIKNDR